MFSRMNIGRMPHPTTFFAIGATWVILSPDRFKRAPSNLAQCFWFGLGSNPTPKQYTYTSNQQVSAPPSTFEKTGNSLEEFFAANPKLVNLTRICADLSSIIYGATDNTRSSKDILTSEISKRAKSNPLLAQLELVDSWRDGAVFLHKESKVLFCVARGTEFELTKAGIRDLANDALLFIGAPAQSRLMSFIQRVDDAKKKYPDYVVLTTGHSLGGAVAHDYAMHYPDSYSIVFSPGGTPADRNNNGLEKTWLSSNSNIVAFKPSNDGITKWFDCSGITIDLPPTGHGINENVLTSSNDEEESTSESTTESSFTDTEPSFYQEKDKPSNPSTGSNQGPTFFPNASKSESFPKNNNEFTSGSKPSTSQSSKDTGPGFSQGTSNSSNPSAGSNQGSKSESFTQAGSSQEKNTSKENTGSAQVSTADPKAGGAKQEVVPKLETPPVVTHNSSSKPAPSTLAPNSNHLVGDMPKTNTEIIRERDQELKSSKKEYYDKKHELKDSMPRSPERKELIRQAQEERHKRDEKIHSEAHEKSWMADRESRIIAHEIAAEESKSSKRDSDSRPTKSSPSLGEVAVLVATNIAAERISNANNSSSSGEENTSSNGSSPSTIRIRRGSRRS